LAKRSLSDRISQEGVQSYPGGFTDNDTRATVRYLLFLPVKFFDGGYPRTLVHTTVQRQKKQGS
jgi:hypothetical protein